MPSPTLERPVIASPQAFIDEIARDIYRISVAVPPSLIPGGFSFNQYLVADAQPLLFHTGPRRVFELVCAQIEKVMRQPGGLPRRGARRAPGVQRGGGDAVGG
jgi:hypothetical protein